MITNKSSNKVYVIGHINPDTDSIAAALGYSWLLNERDGVQTIAARAGAINRQTAFVLKALALDPPLLLTDASPRFESVMRRLDVVTPEKPVNEAWKILNRTGGLAPIVNLDGTPFGLITGHSLFEFMSRVMGPHPKNKEMTLTEMLEIPCREAAETNIPKYQASTRIKDVLNRLLRDELDEFWVVDEQSRYLGICRQRDLLNPPRLKLILVDHNESQQALASLEEAELIEILDHHRLGNPTTYEPIRFNADIVGSTSTLISEEIEEIGLSAPPKLAGLLLAGLLSDTLNLSSPTTTERDKLAANRLGRWAIVTGSPIENETVSTFGQKVLEAGSGLTSQDPQTVVSSDMKIYEIANYKFAIAQAEVSDVYEIGEYIEPLREALEKLKEHHGLDFAMLMITDVVQASSRLIFAGAPPALDELPYRPLADGTRLADGVVSRKKQLLPIVFSLLEV
ncbi:MAG: DHH family phosphoesterase [Anaerolineaceae bacterium]|nr:DHH family phosphoesterase [Anaerolineaceae bacterium]